MSEKSSVFLTGFGGIIFIIYIMSAIYFGNESLRFKEIFQDGVSLASIFKFIFYIFLALIFPIVLACILGYFVAHFLGLGDTGTGIVIFIFFTIIAFGLFAYMIEGKYGINLFEIVNDIFHYKISLK